MERLSEGFYGQILCIGGIVYHSQDDVVDRVTVTVQQLGISPAVAVQCTVDYLKVILCFI